MTADAYVRRIAALSGASVPILDLEIPPLPYEAAASLARWEADRDVAYGMPVSGFDLDVMERLAREEAAAATRRFLFGT